MSCYSCQRFESEKRRRDNADALVSVRLYRESNYYHTGVKSKRFPIQSALFCIDVTVTTLKIIFNFIYFAVNVLFLNTLG